MRSLAQKFLAYYPIILIVCQFIVNILYMANVLSDSSLYYINAFVGTNILASIFVVIYTHYFKFCHISKIASIVEIVLALDVLFFDATELYNLFFQTTILLFGIIASTITSINKFPNCTLALLVRFTKSIFKSSKSCENVLLEFKEQSYQSHLKRLNNA